MEKITVLGTAGAVANAQRDNVSLLWSADDAHVLLECGGSAAHKLARLGVAYERLEHVIITHTHLDHVYGLPGLIFSIAYKDVNRTTPFRVYCPETSVAAIQALLDVFKLRVKFGFPIEVYGIPLQEDAPILEIDAALFSATPVDHSSSTLTMGVKIVSKSSGAKFVYSSDTGYSERLIRFARHADLLFHECAGLAEHEIVPHHSNARQVGDIARQSDVRRLVLLHLDTVLDVAPESLVAQVKEQFAGSVEVASDFDEYVLS